MRKKIDSTKRQVNVAVDPESWDRLDSEARSNERSMRSEALVLIREALVAREQRRAEVEWARRDGSFPPHIECAGADRDEFVRRSKGAGFVITSAERPENS